MSTSHPLPVNDAITLDDITLDCIIGIYERERTQKQAIKCSVRLELDLRQACWSGAITDTLDYAKIYGELRFILLNGHFQLLETAADALARYLLAPPILERPKIFAAQINLTKLQALEGQVTASVSIFRRSVDYGTLQESTHFGKVDIIHESSDCGIYRFRVAPHKEIPAHYHDVLAESEMALSDGLRLQGQALKSGLMYTWPLRFVHKYENPTAVEQFILCIDRPRFNASDEIVTTEKLSDLNQITPYPLYPV